MNVKELSRDQLEELKQNYYYTFVTPTYYLGMNYPDGFWSIPDKVIFKYYAGISFVNDDFCCSMGMD